MLHKLKIHLKTWGVLYIFCLIGLFFNLYNNNFGLPHSFHADEPEIAELAIKYTFDFRRIVSEKEYYEFIPINFVYGTFPAYYNTLLTMGYSKANNLLGNDFSKESIYVFLRTINGFIGILGSVTIVVLFYELFAQKVHKRNKLFLTLPIIVLAFLNYKLIVHAHYLNVDQVVWVLLTLSYYTMYKYFSSVSDTKYTILSGIFVGLAFGTKVTAFLTLPLYLLLFMYKKDYRNMFGFIFSIIGAFIITNPFSIAFADRFALRTYMLTVKENGLVFDSANFSSLKSIVSLAQISTPVIFLLSLYGILETLFNKDLRNKFLDQNTHHKRYKTYAFHLFLIFSVVIYVLFFAIGTRKVDRWLLPVLPIILIYAAYAITNLKNISSNKAWFFVLVVPFASYLYFPILLLFQYQRYTPKAQAYLYMRDNTSELSKKLVITKEGLDPMNKLPAVSVYGYNVYESDGAALDYPPQTEIFDYVVLSSRPMQYFKNPIIKEKYPHYSNAWQDFENTVTNEEEFTLIKTFSIPKPNLIDVSDVFIYQRNYSK